MAILFGRSCKMELQVFPGKYCQSKGYSIGLLKNAQFGEIEVTNGVAIDLFNYAQTYGEHPPTGTLMKLCGYAGKELENTKLINTVRTHINRLKAKKTSNSKSDEFLNTEYLHYAQQKKRKKDQHENGGAACIPTTSELLPRSQRLPSPSPLELPSTSGILSEPLRPHQSSLQVADEDGDIGLPAHPPSPLAAAENSVIVLPPHPSSPSLADEGGVPDVSREITGASTHSMLGEEVTDENRGRKPQTCHPVKRAGCRGMCRSKNGKRRKKGYKKGYKKKQPQLLDNCVDFSQLSNESLTKYKEHFGIAVRSPYNRKRLQKVVAKHFRSIPVSEETTVFFCFMAKHCAGRY